MIVELLYVWGCPLVDPRIRCTPAPSRRPFSGLGTCGYGRGQQLPQLLSLCCTGIGSVESPPLCESAPEQCSAPRAS